MLAMGAPAGLPLPLMSDPTPDERIKAAIFTGQKIEAIKLHREQTGMGLKESKDAVEKLEAELRASTPDRFTKPQGVGCMSVIAVFASLVVWRILA